MKYLALALAFASVIIPLNSPRGSKPKTPGSGPREQLNTPNPSENPKGSDLTNTNKPYQSELNDHDYYANLMKKVFVTTVLAFRIFNLQHQRIRPPQPDLPPQLNIRIALNLAASAFNFPTGAAAAEARQPNPSNLPRNIAKTDKSDLHKKSIEPLSSQALLLELPSPSR